MISKLHSSVALIINLRPYTTVDAGVKAPVDADVGAEGPAAAEAPDSSSALAPRQGLTLVHFSAQPGPFLKQKHTVHTP